MLALFIAFVAVALLLIALAVPLIRRRVPPNSLYGVRVAATFADEWVWYEANASSGRDMLVLGVVQLMVAVVFALLDVPEGAYAIINIATLLVGTIGLAILGVRRARQLLLRRRSAAA